MKRALHVGISPCPNDTFAFHGLLAGAVDTFGLELSIELADVEALNRKLARGALDASKASFAAALRMSDALVVLPCGAALGHGLGPLLLAAAPPRARNGERARRAIPADARVLCPGEATTAHLLYRAFHPGEGRIEHVPFDAIMPALRARRADFGVCIHEARFTWREHGLALVEDLGETWAARTRQPLPLGGIVARRTLGSDVLARLCAAIRGSLDYAHVHRAEALQTMQAHAQETADDVLWAHVSLYVNGETRELGPSGARALDALAALARTSGFIDDAAARLAIFDPTR